MTYADVSDVAAELGRPSPIDSVVVAQWTAWLRRVEAVIRVRIPNLDALVASGAVLADNLAAVEAAVVARKVSNPEGLRSTTTAIDDGTLTKVRDSGEGGSLALSDAEWALILPRRARGAFTVRPQWG